MSTLEALLRRERVVVAAGLAALMLLAWIYIWRGAGMGMSALDMTMVTLFPHTQTDPMQGMTMPPMTWGVVVAMWWVMMIAMMTPGAAPIVLLYGRVLRHAATNGHSGSAYVPSTYLVIGYLTVWLAFSIAATAIQYLLQRAGLISAMMLWSKNAVLSAALLIGAGMYQLSPLKQACLAHCRGPVDFLTRHWRPGRLGALVMGLDHGMFCVGCCWMLMLLLFVGGVMNIAWIALLALLVVAEKIFAGGEAIGRFAGVVLMAWGAATLAI